MSFTGPNFTTCGKFGCLRDEQVEVGDVNVNGEDTTMHHKLRGVVDSVVDKNFASSDRRQKMFFNKHTFFVSTFCLNIVQHLFSNSVLGIPISVDPDILEDIECTKFVVIISESQTRVAQPMGLSVAESERTLTVVKLFMTSLPFSWAGTKILYELFEVLFNGGMRVIEGSQPASVRDENATDRKSRISCLGS